MIATDTSGGAYTGADPTVDASESDANSGTAGVPDPSAPAATTPVPAPGGGDINQTVPAVELTTNSPVELTQTAEAGSGVKISLAGIESVTTVSELPGEIAGPGLKITITVQNTSAAAVDLNNVVVDVQDAAGTPSIPMGASPAAPFTGSVQPGASATGVYVFTLPTSYTNPATVVFSYSTEAPVVLFVGDAK